MSTEDNIHVFLVEDDTTYAATLTQYLSRFFKSKIRVDSFTSGEKCLEKIEKDPKQATDVVILDYYLNSNSPKAMNGIEVLKKIKEINSKITVVILSAQDKMDIAADSIKHGAYEYIVKSESGFIRTHNIIKNLMAVLVVAKASRIYEKWNIAMAALILILVIIDVILYVMR